MFRLCNLASKWLFSLSERAFFVARSLFQRAPMSCSRSYYFLRFLKPSSLLFILLLLALLCLSSNSLGFLAGSWIFRIFIVADRWCVADGMHLLTSSFSSARSYQSSSSPSRNLTYILF